jgi:oligopeptide/dipeptide ABC transporter ATP-binding protein
VSDPALRREKMTISGEMPSPVRPPLGCRFHTRCPLAQDRCRTETPAMIEARPHHFVACHARALAPIEDQSKETSP